MNREKSLMAVKAAIGGGQTYFGNADVIVEHNGQYYLYKDIHAKVTYNIGYMQMDVSLTWDNDSEQVSYQKLGLHLGYNSNFQDFSLNGKDLQWKDGVNHISAHFK